MANSELLEPGLILSRNAKFKSVWTAADLGYMLRLGIVRGKKLIRGCLINENDVIILYEFRKNIKKTKKD